MLKFGNYHTGQGQTRSYGPASGGSLWASGLRSLQGLEIRADATPTGLMGDPTTPGFGAIGVVGLDGVADVFLAEVERIQPGDFVGYQN